MGKSDSKTPTSIHISTQSEEVEEQKPNPSLILLSSGDDAYEELSRKTVENSIVRACINANSTENPSFSSESEVFITDVKKTKMAKEIVGVQSNVEDTEKKEENIESIETEGFLEIDTSEKSDNVILKKLLRGPRYFDPQDNNWGNCYNCGETGHTVASCTTPKRKKPCFVCGNLEHNAKQCKQGKDCFICKKSGHRAKSCPEKTTKGFHKTKLCLKCGDSGHEMFTCKNSYSLDDLKEVECYICNSFGHLCCFDYGKGETEISCYRCGQLGHTGLECKNHHAHVETTTTMSPSSCYKCGVEGHKARKCPTSSKKRKRKAKFSQNLQETPNHIGVRSAPHGVVEGRNRNKTQNGHSTPYQPRHRGRWMNEDIGGYNYNNHVNNWEPLSTPPTYYQSNNIFHGNYGANNYGYGNSFPYEGSGSNGYRHGFPRSRFGESSGYGRREYNYDY
ncbi:hypothetical protein LXL04_023273 [Taraxacum kok-saghyz]